MKLNEIIEKAEQGKYIPYEEIKARKNQLIAYFEGYYNSEPIILVWNATNAGGATTITTASEYSEGVEQVLNNYYPDLNEEEREQETELINFNSKFLKDI